MWSDSGIRVHLLAFLHVWLLSLDYCMYFYTEITYVLYATSAILNFLFEISYFSKP